MEPAKSLLVLTSAAASEFLHDHSSLVGAALALALACVYLPPLLALLVTLSPVIACTAFLLGVVLSYGEPNPSDPEEEYRRLREISSKTIAAARRARSTNASGSRWDDEAAKSKGGRTGLTPRHHSSGCSSGSSSPTASDDDENIPMTDEIQPLLDDVVQPPPALQPENSDESENFEDLEEEDVEEEDDEEDGDDEETAVMSWTADDQKNMMEVGMSELERNQRLENLIARRRARALHRKQMERNLIDLDSITPPPTIEELRRFGAQIPQVIAPRRNPFDIDDFPDSAPSILPPSWNPFALPPEHHHLDQPRNAFFRRHESFTAGAPFLAELCLDTGPTRFQLEQHFPFSKTGAGSDRAEEDIDWHITDRGTGTGKFLERAAHIVSVEEIIASSRSSDDDWESPSYKDGDESESSRAQEPSRAATDNSDDDWLSSRDSDDEAGAYQRLTASWNIRSSSPSQVAWMALPSLLHVDEAESKAAGVAEITERDVLGDELPKTCRRR